jgi:hypothetical protein
MSEKKTFMQVKPGDTIYKVCIYDYKTRIIKKTVKSIKNKDNGTITIHCECKDSEYYSNMFPSVDTDSSLHLVKYSPNTYLCSDLENARIACHRLANEIVSKTDKQISKLWQRVSKWRMHQEELVRGNYIIK